MIAPVILKQRINKIKRVIDFPMKLFKLNEENILFSTRKIPRKFYLESFMTFSQDVFRDTVK